MPYRHSSDPEQSAFEVQVASQFELLPELDDLVEHETATAVAKNPAMVAGGGRARLYIATW
jgi:hypothetical protein